MFVFDCRFNGDKQDLPVNAHTSILSMSYVSHFAPEKGKNLFSSFKISVVKTKYAVSRSRFRGRIDVVLRNNDDLIFIIK